MIRLEGYPSAKNKLEVQMRSKDHIIYSNRDFMLHDKNLKKYMIALDRYEQQSLGESERTLIASHKAAIQDALEIPRTYNANVCGLSLDEKNVLELIGVAEYSRPYQLIYDFSSHLEVFLMYLFHEKYEVIHEGLLRNCDKLGADYSLLSKGTMNNDFWLLKDIPIGVFFDITYKMDEWFAKILRRRSFDNVRKSASGQVLDMTTYSDVDYLFYQLALRIWGLMDSYVCQEFIRIYNQDMLAPVDAKTQITSKGYANLVIQIEYACDAKPIQISAQNKVFDIVPIISKKGEYYKHLME